ncbi:hypothetical protein RFI_25914 [Reticulomyxa filosa]|uniref:Uncharacterized protein n=1 Tax=Reticulomyxa filosa TaxID=46433 RepID=X6MDG8_RETFI|nr:hypothetical protein RFI_25914 [Reticulomyxa filosa]|eukprot:ETO11462.1 hypothetical protein RFI_25914 [Reticulomyxa filosa]
MNKYLYNDFFNKKKMYSSNFLNIHADSLNFPDCCVMPKQELLRRCFWISFQSTMEREFLWQFWTVLNGTMKESIKMEHKEENDTSEGPSAAGHTGYGLAGLQLASKSNRKRASKVLKEKMICDSSGAVIGDVGVDMEHTNVGHLRIYSVGHWCDVTQLQMYYKCVGFCNDRYAFVNKQDHRAELIDDHKGYWYLVCDKTIMYKSSLFFFFTHVLYFTMHIL